MQKLKNIFLYLNPAAKAALLAGAVALYGYHGARAINELSVTYDETVHLTAGYVAWKARDFKYFGWDHPPLAEMTAALPLYLGLAGAKPQLYLTHPSFRQGLRYVFADFFIFQNVVDARRLIGLARWSVFLIFSALLFYASRRLGELLFPGAGFWSLLLLSSEPNLLAHGALIATDFGSAVFYAVAFLACLAYLRGPGFWRAFLLGGTLAGLLLIKHTNLIALPILALWAFAEYRAKALMIRWSHLAGLACGFAVFLFAVYLGTNPGMLFEGLWSTWKRAGLGRSAFLFGHYSNTGWFYYLPCAVLLKSNIVHLLLGAIGLFLFVKTLAWKKERWPFFFLALPLFHFLFACNSRVQIGLRYALPIYPFLVLLGGYALARIAAFRAKGVIISLTLAAAASVSTFRVSPWFLSYFNELSGGPGQGHRYLVDSNLDWGQGLAELARYVKAQGVHSIYLSYFGVADPHYYGLSYIPLGMVNSGLSRPGDLNKSPTREKKIYFAISATNYRAVYFADRKIFAWLDSLQPEVMPAHSIFLFDLTQAQAARQQLAQILLTQGFAAEAQRLSGI